jgi:hypothetical protein
MRSARYLTRMLTAVRLVFASLVAFIGSRAALAAEILALRHQLGVLERSSPARLPLMCWDRALWVFLLRHWSGWKDSLVRRSAPSLLPSRGLRPAPPFLRLHRPLWSCVRDRTPTVLSGVAPPKHRWDSNLDGGPCWLRSHLNPRPRTDPPQVGLWRTTGPVRGRRLDGAVSDRLVQPDLQRYKSVGFGGGPAGPDPRVGRCRN